ncbi:MAG: DrmB family protein [Negativicutes bacterium]
MVFLKKPIRRSQLISPWGVGAIVPFPDDESLMIAGLDMWRYNTTNGFIVKDERLQKRLGVKELRWPPDFRDRETDPQNFNLKIPAVKFPRWHYCPFCGTMQKLSYYTNEAYCNAYQWEHGRKCDPKRRYKKKLIPERFVVICPEGHIDDFPVAEWLHSDSEYTFNPHTCYIRRSTGGTSAALTSVFYECSCGAKKSVAAATRPGALKKIGYRCKGTKPWLGIEEDKEKPCENEDIKVVQRGASNVWFADTRSSIHIPTDDETANRRIIGILSQYFDSIKSHRKNGEIDRTFIEMLAEGNGVDTDELYAATLKKLDNMDGLPEVTEDISEDDYRLAEYKVLIKSCGSDALDFHSKNFPISTYHPSIHKYFKSISLVPKLRETRAFIGFSRLEPDSKSIAEKKNMLRLGTGGWLPAIEVYGEGIFFEFNSDSLKQWAQPQSSAMERISKLNHAYHGSFFGKTELGNLRPEFVMIHTFAHLIINQLSYECGYGSSSIRERLYCAKCDDKNEMFGVLLYTASGDSEGSLGGLVRQGEKGKIEDTILSAMETARWCSSDPICIQSTGQGPESCNLAACHNCALLPETCCEFGNRLLDRGLVIGTLDDAGIGYFNI